jgi:hypothetical protein
MSILIGMMYATIAPPHTSPAMKGGSSKAELVMVWFIIIMLCNAHASKTTYCSPTYQDDKLSASS